HRGIRRARLEEMRAQLVDHLLVGEGFQFAQPPQPGEVERGKPFRLDGVEIPPAALHAQRVDAVSEQVLPGDLDGGVSSAVHDEIGFGADQPGGVDAKRQGLAPARRVAVAELSGLGVGPAVLHRVEAVVAAADPACCSRKRPERARNWTMFSLRDSEWPSLSATMYSTGTFRSRSARTIRSDSLRGTRGSFAPA